MLETTGQLSGAGLAKRQASLEADICYVGLFRILCVRTADEEPVLLAPKSSE